MRLLSILLLGTIMLACSNQEYPWEHGNLQVSENNRYFVHADGTPFFWLGDTGWLLPERLTREEVNCYLDNCRECGFNVVQVQVINDVPASNVYGELSHPNGYDFSQIDTLSRNGYWQHMDYIVDAAAGRGIYIGMVCIWGGLVKKGLMTEEEADAYGKFLSLRYREKPNIFWMIGGDITGDTRTEIWNKLARSIKAHDKNHLMTFHPRGRTISSSWFADAEWIDFHMFQSGHRRYNQDNGDKNYPIAIGTEEDSWRYVERALAHAKPVVDGEPSYEAIPIGLHDPTQGFWQAADVRRYAYWSVFAGAAGHTYGHNSIMQFYLPGNVEPAYSATIPWKEAMQAEGRHQMKYLRELMERVDFTQGKSAQNLLLNNNGTRYDRLIALSGNDYLLVYTYTGCPIHVSLDSMALEKKYAWWYDPRTGTANYISIVNNSQVTFTPPGEPSPGNDWVLVISSNRDTL